MDEKSSQFLQHLTFSQIFKKKKKKKTKEEAEKFALRSDTIKTFKRTFPYFISTNLFIFIFMYKLMEAFFAKPHYTNGMYLVM